jgi:ubiquinone/menaquinone biosynthesis C-methylase UbiE
MDKEALAAMWNRSAPTFDQVGPRVFADLGRQLVEFAQIDPGTEVLDIACGRGAILFPAARQVGASGRPENFIRPGRFWQY